MSDHTTHTPAGHGPHHLLLGTVTVSRLLGADETDGSLSLVMLKGVAGSGPGPHVDPWCESFYVLEGQLTFRVEESGSVHTVVAGAGDAVSIPAGIGHAFSVTSEGAARYLIAGTPAGIDSFFADAGEPIDQAELPDAPPSLDRDRLRRAFAKHGLTPYELPSAADPN